MPLGAILGASVISGGLGLMAADEQADAAYAGAQMAAGASARTRKDLMPFTNAGVGALRDLMWLAGIETPGQEFRSLDDFKVDLANSGRFTRGGSGGGSWVSNAEGTGFLDWVPDGTGGTAGSLDQPGLNREAQRLFDAQRPRDSSFGSLTKPFEFNLADFYKDPGYQFRRDQGEEALMKGAAAVGMRKSSANLKNLMTFNQNLASQEYDSSFKRAFGVDNTNRERQTNLLMQIAGMGQSSAAMTGANAMTAANTGAAALMSAGSASAAGLGSVSNAIQGGLGNWMYNNRWNQQMGVMQSMFAPRTAGGYTGAQLNDLMPS